MRMQGAAAPLPCCSWPRCRRHARRAPRPSTPPALPPRRPRPCPQVLHELLDMLRLQGQAQHSDFLEVIIIVLICVGE